MNERYQIVKGMHEIIRSMNNEEAYMDWIYTVPDGAEVPDATDEDVADDILDVDLDSVGDVDVESDVQPTVADDEPVIMLDSEQLNLF